MSTAPITAPRQGSDLECIHSPAVEFGRDVPHPKPDSKLPTPDRLNEPKVIAHRSAVSESRFPLQQILA